MVSVCSTDFSPDLIFDCGQCFRFDRYGGGWSGVAFGRVLGVYPEDGGYRIDCSEEDYNVLWRDFFDMEADYAAAAEAVSLSPFMTQAARACRGIRILRQDFWEALCSFIISQCNNIPRIKGIIRRLCEKAGEDLGSGHYAFPPPESVAALSEAELLAMGMGYRAEYVRAAAIAVAKGELSREKLLAMPITEARKTLTSLRGVGIKVADCALLYGLHRMDSFPVDVWMKRALGEHFPKDFDPAVFGDNAGIAQQYIFHYVRTGAGGNGE